MRTNTVDILLSRGIRPSPQRVAIFDALLGRSDHPTAEKMFHVLRPSMPTLSKTTVLSTMRLFQDAGLFHDVRCEEGELRFDGNRDFHAHFKCRKCEALYDIPIECAHENTYTPLPKGFVVDDEQLIYYGFCPHCSTNNKENTK